MSTKLRQVDVSIMSSRISPPGAGIMSRRFGRTLASTRNDNIPKVALVNKLTYNNKVILVSETTNKTLYY
jgi:hypothetical protein